MEEKVRIKHELIPEHFKLSEEEKQEVLKKFNVVERNLPSVLYSDPGLVGLDVEPGDVIKVLRKSQIRGVIEFFRVVIHD